MLWISKHLLRRGDSRPKKRCIPTCFQHWGRNLAIRLQIKKHNNLIKRDGKWNWICSVWINTENTAACVYLPQGGAFRETVCGNLESNPIKNTCVVLRWERWTSRLNKLRSNLPFNCTECSYSHRMSFLYLWTKQTAATHVMTFPGCLMKSFDPFMFTSYKSDFTVSPASILYKPQWGRREAVPWGQEMVSAPLNPHVAGITPFKHKLLLQRSLW